MQASGGRQGQARSIILCADDYGMNAGVSRAILDLAAAGRISATSCMTNAPGWPQAARDLAAIEGRAGLGLHLTLTWGRPLGPMPGFAIPDGRMPPLGTVIRRSLTRTLPRAELRSEIERQLDAFGEATGRAPDFVDGHQHVHALPGIREELLEILEGRGLAGRIWLRDPSDRLDAIVSRRLSVGKALFVAALASGFRAQARASGFALNEGFSGFGPFDPARDVAGDFARYLVRLGPDPLVMCHPGRPDPDSAADEIAAARAREYAFLASPTCDDALLKANVTLAAGPIRPFPTSFRGGEAEPGIHRR